MNNQNNAPYALVIVPKKSTKNFFQKSVSLNILRFVLVAISTFALIASSFIAFGFDSNGDSIDDSLSVAAAVAGAQAFPETGAGSTETMTEIDFNNAETNDSMTDGNPISGRRLYGESVDQSVVLGTAQGTFNYYDATVWGGAGGTGINPAVSGSTWEINFNSTQRYIGFWWSAGNAQNFVQLLDGNGNVLLDPQFTTQGVISSALAGNWCPGSYDGSYPDETYLNDNPWAAYCGNPNPRFEPDGTDPYYAPEPYAFVHLRFQSGFRGVRFSGSGFEFDNLTVSETIPSESSTEVVVSTPEIIVDVNANLPSVLLVDPRANSKNFPNIPISLSTGAMICISQVSDISGSEWSGENTVLVSRTDEVANITETTDANIWRYSGPRSDLEAQIPTIQLQGIENQPLVQLESKFIRVHITSNTAAAGCTDSQVNQIIEIRPLGLTNTLRKGTIQLK